MGAIDDKIPAKVNASRKSLFGHYSWLPNYSLPTGTPPVWKVAPIRGRGKVSSFVMGLTEPTKPLHVLRDIAGAVLP